MKNLLTIICSTLMISVVALAQAQDSTSTEHNNKKGGAEETQGATMNEAGVRDGVISTEDQAQEGGRPTQEQIDQSTPEQNTQPTERGESTLIDEKMGPKGEPVFLNNGAYYYLNEAGEKVKIEKSMLKDKTQ